MKIHIVVRNLAGFPPASIARFPVVLIVLAVCIGCARNGPHGFTERQQKENRFLIREFRRLEGIITPPAGAARSEIEDVFGACAVSGDGSSRQRVYRLDETEGKHPAELHVTYEGGKVVTARVSDAPEMANAVPVCEGIGEENEIYRNYVRSLKRFLAEHREEIRAMGGRKAASRE